MERKFRRFIWGYSPHWVEREINSMKSDFQKQYEIMQKELLKVQEENQDKKEKIIFLKNNWGLTKDIKNNIEERIFKAHMDACLKVHDCLKAFSLLEKEKLNTLLEYRKKFDALDDEIQKFTEKINKRASM